MFAPDDREGDWEGLDDDWPSNPSVMAAERRSGLSGEL